MMFFFFSSRRRHTRSLRDWSSDVCSSDLSPDIKNHQIEVLNGVQCCFECLKSGRDDCHYDTLARCSNCELEELVCVRLNAFRSEERRVGKECRYRWSPYE